MGLFQKYMIPIPIPVPTAPGTNSKMELVPRRESITQLDLDPGLESVPLIQLALQIGKEVQTSPLTVTPFTVTPRFQ